MAGGSRRLQLPRDGLPATPWPGEFLGLLELVDLWPGLGALPARGARHERVRPRRRRRLPHLLGVRARDRHPLGHVPVARPRATWPQRNRRLVPPSRRIRRSVTRAREEIMASPA